eukprot:scaffold92073_cov46-Cyclotella_meneghiniana.AAC.2
MDRPRTPKELRRFIGCVNYYRDMWPSRAHILKPLTDQAGLKKGEKLNWTDEMQQAFDKMRLLLAADALHTQIIINPFISLLTPLIFSLELALCRKVVQLPTLVES